MAVQKVFLLVILACFITYSIAFYNPIVSQGQDPSVKYYNGNYYLTQSRDNGIVVVRSPKLEDLGNPAETVKVWNAGSGNLCCEIWAPELVYIKDQDRWYIYFAADDGNNANHRSYALESSGNNPLGPYTLIGEMAVATDMWAIDSTVMNLNNQLYYVWSGWPENSDFQQNLYIASMSSPTTLSSDRYLLSEPTNDWEIAGNGQRINEGPAVLQNNGNTFIAYSASGSWENSYCLGLLTYIGGDPLQISSWRKSNGCVFAQDSSKSVYGTGHNSFTTSPDQTQVWNVYHADVQSGAGWNGRSVRAQQVYWNGDGSPNFGVPVSFNDWVDPPSGE
ncbi:hypothetical protein CHUAL_010947 [Chamberlinius hualienensis]